MRNVAFSILLGALALLQVAVVSTELSHAGVQTAAAANDKHDARYAVASAHTAAQTERQTTAL